MRSLTGRSVIIRATQSTHLLAKELQTSRCDVSVNIGHVVGIAPDLFISDMLVLRLAAYTTSCVRRRFQGRQKNHACG